MPGTEITRAQYRRNGLHFASNLTDAEWALIAHRLPPRRRMGRPQRPICAGFVEAIMPAPPS